jgi:hypothetical protein
VVIKKGKVDRREAVIRLREVDLRHSDDIEYLKFVSVILVDLPSCSVSQYPFSISSQSYL